MISRMFEAPNNIMATTLESMPTNIPSSRIFVCLYGALSNMGMGIFKLIYSLYGLYLMYPSKDRK